MKSVAHQFAGVVETEGLGSALIKLPPPQQRNGINKDAVILIFEDGSEFGFYFNGSFWTEGPK